MNYQSTLVRGALALSLAGLLGGCTLANTTVSASKSGIFFSHSDKSTSEPIDHQNATALTVYFESDSSQLSAAAWAKLEAFALQTKPMTARLTRIEGHTDWNESENYNLKLAERRANAVEAALTSLGYQSDQTRLLSFGELQPVADNTLASGRALNRRVVVTLIDPEVK